jgi:hypothetical protein
MQESKKVVIVKVQTLLVRGKKSTADPESIRKALWSVGPPFNALNTGYKHYAW